MVVVKRLVALNQPPPPLERRRVVVPDRAQSCWAEGFLRQQLKRLENLHCVCFKSLFYNQEEYHEKNSEVLL